MGPLLTLLRSDASDDAITSYLWKEVVEHFGLSPDAYDFTPVAQGLRVWFDQDWRNPAEPVTIYVRLLDEGIEVWRSVQARPLGRGLFRIVGVDADVSDEHWQFPAGAIVRCEDKRFDDRTTGLAAVEQVQPAGLTRQP